jgi:hypothetical protein
VINPDALTVAIVGHQVAVDVEREDTHLYPVADEHAVRRRIAPDLDA